MKLNTKQDFEKEINRVKKQYIEDFTKYGWKFAETLETGNSNDQHFYITNQYVCTTIKFYEDMGILETSNLSHKSINILTQLKEGL
jgi:hypothetical protein